MRIRLSQRYLKIIEDNSLLKLSIFFILLYLFIALVFSILYFIFDGICCTYSIPTAEYKISYLDHLYFSLITQSTIGYGDLRPFGIARLFVIIQTIFSLFIFAIGTGVIVLKLLTPNKNSILIHDKLLFYPKAKRFKIRILNTLPIDLNLVEVHARYIYVNNTKTVRKTINLLKNNIIKLYSMRPLPFSTLPVSEIKNEINFKPGDQITLEPSFITGECKIVFVLSAKYFAGEIVVEKSFYNEDIECGSFVDTSADPSVLDTEHDISKWELYKKLETACESCAFVSNCKLKNG